MEIYMVGGAVRDKLLGLPVSDRDWVVVGATPEQMTARGYRQVGRDFPVFLHPRTNEEYALARTERKSGPGYRGFTVYTSPEVALEEDLKRRDLTINAIAEAEDGTIIDPFGGIDDLKQRRLRHVSPAFAEDPLRILRVARFCARFYAMGFRVDPATRALMKKMVSAGEVDALVSERVWIETCRSLGEAHPAKYFETLRSCGALAVLFPELERLFGLTQAEARHPEIDCGVHALLTLERASELSQDARVRFAALMHNLGKGGPDSASGSDPDADSRRGVERINTLCTRVKAPVDFRDLAIIVARYHEQCHRVTELKPSAVLALLEGVDAFRRKDRFEQFLLACEADATGRPGYENAVYEQADVLRDALAAAAAVDARALAQQGLKGKALAARLRDLRVAAIARSRHPLH